MTTTKQFNITVYKEEFIPIISPNRIEELKHRQYHGFKVRGTSEDPDIQRLDHIDASMAIKPEEGDLVVVKVEDSYRIEKHPNESGVFIATVVGGLKSFK